MKNKKFLLLGVSALALGALVGCGSKKSDTSNSSNNTSETSSVSHDYSKKVDLKMSVQYAKIETRMSFSSSATAYKLPYTDPSGKTYNDGDLKPVWEAVSQRLNIGINDVTPKDSVSTSFADWQTKGFDQVDIFQGGASAIQNHATANKGTILDLSKYLDRMPNFKAFLKNNKVVEKTITTYDGNIYYAPYFDGYDDVEKMVLMRVDFVKKLLDGAELPTGLNTTDFGTTAYQAYMPETLDTSVDVLKDGKKDSVTKKYTKGIIAIQNELGTKNGNSLVKALRDYIDSTYKNADGTPYYGTTRSDLFVGENAAYDADELVALFRCVKANGAFLSGKADGKVTPLFNRENKNSRVGDLWGMMGAMFGVRGMMSKNGFLYVDSEGKIQDGRFQQSTVDALERFSQMYKEGLILQDFTTDTAGGGTGGSIYKGLHGNNAGFCSFDYAQTQSAHNYTYQKDFKDFDFEPVITPVARWNGKNTYERFHESWRSVKTEGWAISANLEKPGNEDKLDRALALFDYFWTDEGNRLMSYGPDQYLAKNSDGSIATIKYMGNDVPELASATIEQLKTLTSYNYTNYYRYYLGATFPVGYVKEQGMEYQCNVPEGKNGLDKVENAIAAGVIKHPDVNWSNEDKWNWIVPTTFAFDATAADSISKNFTKLDNYINNTNGKSNAWSNIVQYGFGYTSDTVTTLTKENYIQTLLGSEYNGQTYIDLYNEYWPDMIN